MAFDSTIRVAGYVYNSLANGDGVRDVIFLSGCKLNCKGCQNKELQDENFGEDVLIADIVDRVKENIGIIDGVTISGGDPFYQADKLYLLCKELKKHNINIWVYTGNVYLDIIKNKSYERVLDFIDVLVDGPFIESLKTDVKYIGSSNQNIIRLNKWRVKHYETKHKTRYSTK